MKNQQAMPYTVIMAGGEGSRLRPITETMPKPLVPIAGEAAMTHILRLLARYGVSGATVSLCYRGEQIRAQYGAEAAGIPLTYSEEHTPLGTAGGVRAALCAGGYAGGDVLVLSGDAICDFDLRAAYQAHREGGADATLLLAHSADAPSFGVVLCEGEMGGRIRAFSEKPSECALCSDTVSTGIYFLSEKIVEMIPKDLPYDFGRDLFPQAMRAGLQLSGITPGGYWCDIGTLDAFYACNFDARHGKIGGIAYQPTEKEMGEDCVMGQGCHVSAAADVRRSVLFDSVRIAAGAVVEDAILCRGVRIGRGAAVGRGCVLGAGTVVRAGMTVAAGVKTGAGADICCKTTAHRSTDETQPSPVFDGYRAAADYFDANGLVMGSARTPDAAFAVRFGTAAAGCCGGAGQPLGIMTDGSDAAHSTAALTAQAAGAAGAECLLCGQGDANIARYAAVRYRTALFLYVRTDGRHIYAHLFDETGLYPPRETERRLEAGLSRTYAPADRIQPQQPTAVGGIHALLAAELRPYLQGAPGMPPWQTKGVVADSTLRPLCVRFGTAPSRGAPLVFCFARDGELFVYENGVSFDRWQLSGLLLATGSFLPQGTRLAFPAAAPLFLDTLAQARGREVIRYMHCPSEAEHQTSIRRLAAQQAVFSNGLFLAAATMGLLAERGQSLSELASSLPPHARRSATVSPPRSARSNVLHGIHALDGRDERTQAPGVRIWHAGGNILITPQRRAAFRIIADAADAEAAEELVAFGKKTVADLCKKGGERPLTRPSRG